MADAATILDSSVSTAVATPADPKAPVDPKTADPAAKNDKVSQSLQILVQREKRALERERAAKAKELELTDRMRDFETREARLKEFESVKDQDPTKALEMLGRSYKELTDIQMSDGKVPVEQEVQRLRKQLEDWKAAQTDAEKKRLEDEHKSAQANEQKIVEDFKKSLATFCEETPKDYELINFEGPQAKAMVFEVIDEHYNRTLKAAQELDPEGARGEIMDKKTAADKVEKWLRENKYAKVGELEFIKQLLGPRQEKPAVKQNDFLRPTQNRTLTNQMSATAAPAPRKIVTDDERVQRAIAYAKGLRP